MNDFNQNKNTETEVNIPQTESMSQNTQPKEKSVGSIIAIIIIIAVIIIGGLYFWGKTINDLGINTDKELTSDEMLNSLNTQKTSDELTDIEADLNATDLDELDTELQNIDMELGI